jgi:tryptophanyl-tRNA synthetase
VWKLHQIYSSEETKEWVMTGCRSAGIGCIDCKKKLIERICAEQKPIRERRAAYAQDIPAVHCLLREGALRAREVASKTLKTVRAAMGLEV